MISRLAALSARLRPDSVLVRYGCSVATVALAIWLRHLLDPLLDFEFPYTTTYLAILVTAGYCGRGPAFVATILGGIAVNFFLLPPRGGFALPGVDQQVGLVLYVFVGLGISLLASSMRDSKARLAGRMEEALREAAELNRQVIAGASDGIAVLDRGLRYRLFNPALEAMTGWPVESVLGRAVAELVDASRAAESSSRLRRALEGETVISNDQLLPAHESVPERWLTSKSSPLRNAKGEIVGVIAIAHDITERKRSEKALREQEALLRYFVAHAPASIAMLDPQMRYLIASRRWLRDYGLEGQEVQGRSHYEIFPEIPDRWKEIHRRCLAGAVERAEEEPFVRVDGTVQWIRWEVHPWYSAPETIGGIIILSEDITARKLADEALRTSEENLRLVIEGAKDYAIYMLDLGGRVVTWNAGAERILGYTAEEIVGQSFELFFPPGAIAEGLPQLQLAAAREKGSLDNEGWRVRKDGTRFWADGVVSRLGERDAPRGFSKMVRDLTERHRLEEQLRQSQKMDAFGQLAGGVAHDFNNLLTVIGGYSDLLRTTLPPEDPNREFVAEIHDAGVRASALTSQLLAFSRQQLLEPKVVDLNAVVGGTESMLRRLIGEDILLASSFEPSLSAVRVDPGQVEQVILNLAVNARDAMPLGGALTLETHGVYLDEEYCSLNPECRPGSYIMVAMTDSGSGMTPEVQARIFEPFFTTKGQGKGTGLGLATVFGIVKQSGGHLSVYSEVGVGTTFRVYFPAFEGGTRPSRPDLEKGARRQGAETVLLVEDENAVRKVAKRALESNGFKVLEASCGREALELFEGRQGTIDLVLTDVVMPEMSGRQLAERLRALQADVRILFMSGYTDDAVIRHGIIQAQEAFVQKPFTPTTLVNKIHEVLDVPSAVPGS
jgi:PAS domain S-box-containing protein